MKKTLLWNQLASTFNTMYNENIKPMRALFVC